MTFKNHASGLSFLRPAVIACGLLLASATQAATIEVNSTSDELSPANGECTLRGAVDAINAGANRNGCVAVGSYGNDDKVIFLSYLPVPPTIKFTSEIEVNRALTIDGAINTATTSAREPCFLGCVILNGDSKTRLLKVNAPLTLRNMTVAGGYSNDSGGAVYSAAPLAVNRVIFQFNKSEFPGGAGGAIYGETSISVVDSQFFDNDAETPQGGAGGAIFTSGLVTIRGSTFSGNQVFGSRHSKDTGGAVAADRVVAENSTFLSNMVHSGYFATGQGGAIFARTSFSGSYLTMNGNSALSGAVVYTGHGAFKNSIITSFEPVASCDGDSGDRSFASGTNLEWRFGVGSENSCTSANPVLVSGNGNYDEWMRILSLSDSYNGGPTMTTALAPNSPAINAGDPSVTTASGFDQRGMPRVAGRAPDLGAFEEQNPPEEEEKPQAADDSYEAVEGSRTALTTLQGSVLANDAPGAVVAKVIWNGVEFDVPSAGFKFSTEQFGIVVMTPDGHFFYDAPGRADDNNGKNADRFQYRVVDAKGNLSDLATVTIKLLAEKPKVADDSYEAVEGSRTALTTLQGSVLANDAPGAVVAKVVWNGVEYDVPSEGFKFSTEQGGIAVMNPGGHFFYDAPGRADDNNGKNADRFQYRVVDAKGNLSDLATVTINLLDK